MAFPTLPVLAGLGLATFIFRDKIASTFRKTPATTPAGYVTELQQNKTYAGVAMMSASGGNDPSVGSAHLKTYLTNAGFQVLTDPALRSSDDASKFSMGQPAAWIFTAKWTKSDRYVTSPPDPAIGMVQFVPMPTT